MLFMVDDQTLEELEGVTWGAPPLDFDYMHRIHRVRTMPLSQIPPADLRFMLTLKLSPQHLLGLAIAILRDVPLLQAEYFPGDLLQAALELDPSFYLENKRITAQLLKIAEGALGLLPMAPLEDFVEINQELESRSRRFVECYRGESV